MVKRKLRSLLWLALACAVASPAAWARNLPDFTTLVEQYAPAVVNISTTRDRGARPGAGSGSDLEDYLRRFFPERSPRQPSALGSGFIISEDGYILTNHHVIEDADRIVVRLYDRRELEASLVGADPRSDLAVLKLEANGLPTVKLGRSETLRVGEWVLAIGSPFGFDYSATAGIVSATGRSLPRDNENYVPFIQTDVAINRGNSGGPLFNLDGEVVGINSQIYTRSGGFMGVSFAIPIDVAIEVAEQLRESGRVARGWLGVVIQEVDRDLAESFNLDKPSGALVSRVLEGSPAESGGLRAGDIITQFNGRNIERQADLPHLVGRARAGSMAEITIVREGQPRTFELEIGRLADDEQAVAPSPQDATQAARLGMVVEPLPDALRERLGADAGVRVVEASGPAAESGIRAGDVITRLNNREIDSVEAFNRIVDELTPGRSVPVLIVRGETPTFLALRVPQR
jgi:serine protease Do